jgi:hypothetical protein
MFGASVFGNSWTSHVQYGPRMYLETIDLSVPEYLYWSIAAS